MAGKDGLTKLDVGVLSAEQQETLRQFKVRTRIDNEIYLRSHPEVEELIGDFLRDMLLKRPSDIREFAADYFSSLKTPTDPRMEGNSDME
ncbi:RIIa domain-containing protein 1 [Cololabis saira]|uniref:RIIa domain-containing protein 1 n=1 Tax=Cololabis saira TaxID=129043 RepID=UPI002AD2CEF0|nr:RIIa domain-containing protein 1 [Cololabis saira]